jgi:hypothetical protein
MKGAMPDKYAEHARCNYRSRLDAVADEQVAGFR